MFLSTTLIIIFVYEFMWTDCPLHTHSKLHLADHGHTQCILASRCNAAWFAPLMFCCIPLRRIKPHSPLQVQSLEWICLVILAAFLEQGPVRNQPSVCLLSPLLLYHLETQTFTRIVWGPGVVSPAHFNSFPIFDSFCK